MGDKEHRWTVDEWMTDIPLCVPPSLPVRTAFAKMRVGHFRHLLVMEDGELVGMVTDRDLRRPDVSDDLEGWKDSYNLDDSVHVSDVMTRQLQTVGTDDPLSRAVDLFLDHRFGALPVTDDRGRVTGILSTHDVMRAAKELLPR
jgi:acetoin utilization protein AcuB